MRDTLKGRAFRCGLSIWCSGCRLTKPTMPLWHLIFGQIAKAYDRCL